MQFLGKYKSYSPVVFTVILLFGMGLILIFENFGLTRREENLNFRLGNSIQKANIILEKHENSNDKFKNNIIKIKSIKKKENDNLNLECNDDFNNNKNENTNNTVELITYDNGREKINKMNGILFDSVKNIIEDSLIENNKIIE